MLAGYSRCCLSAADDSRCCSVRFKEAYVGAPRFAARPSIASLQFMRSRGSAPQRETGTGTTTQPGTRTLDDRTERDERHDPDGHRAHHPGSGLDDWIRELTEAAPPLTPAQRYTLALLLNRPRPGSLPLRPSGGRAAAQDARVPPRAAGQGFTGRGASAWLNWRRRRPPRSGSRTARPAQDDQGAGAASINAITHMRWSRPEVRSRAYPGIVGTSWKVRDLCMTMACSAGVPACSTWC